MQVAICKGIGIVLHKVIYVARVVGKQQTGSRSCQYCTPHMLNTIVVLFTGDAHGQNRYCAYWKSFCQNMAIHVVVAERGFLFDGKEEF